MITALETLLADRNPTLLALGEPTHGVAAFTTLRNEFLYHLVEQHGYRSVALESDCLAGRLVDAYVTTGEGDRQAVLTAGFSHGFGNLQGNRDLVEWLRDFNAGQRPADRVRFHGIDAPTEITGGDSPRGVLLELHRFLSAHLDHVPGDVATIEKLVGDDEEWTTEAAMWDPTKSKGDSADAGALRLLTDDLVALLEKEKPGLPEGGDLLARTAQGLLRYHAVVADPAPTRISLMLGQRDAMMAANLLALPRTFVFAHNGHLQRNLSTGQGFGPAWRWWSAGAQVARHLGDRYTFIAGELGASETQPDPDPATLQGYLASVVPDRALVATAGLDPELAARTDAVQGYSPFSDVTGADAIAFLRRV
ncbi:erythromycin esterase family protein [Amycolatopsis ultiminotia]